MELEPVIGLEVHVQLNTVSKIFSGSSTTYGAEPNTQASKIDLGFPGTLPVLNQQAILLAIRFGISIHANITSPCVFARKNYFYPDLPKGYQISQHERPIVQNGYLTIDLDKDHSRCIHIERAHLEEDAGKLIHEGLSDLSGVDFNRASTPLLEIVSHPELYSPREAVCYLKTLHQLIRYLDVSDANMQEGSFRCDANISLRPRGSKVLGTRTEIKNLNSFRFVERALHYEITRQKEVLISGHTVNQETRLYSPERNETRVMRSKEDAHDYRYFPDPDLLPIAVSTELIETIQAALPELPWEKQQRLTIQYELTKEDAKLLTTQQSTADYFEHVLQENTTLSPKLVFNWIQGDLAAALNKRNLSIQNSPISPQRLAQLLNRLADNTLSTPMTKQVFETMLEDSTINVDTSIEAKGLKQIQDSHALEKIIKGILEQNPNQVMQYRNGKDKLMAFFVGQVMKQTKGKANPQQVNNLLKKHFHLTGISHL